ncbi:WD40 repeat-like protein [Pluteus cervinus]|uniref:WD40 repeat-like protein n=1 Tax=Pluteus cervinus TaxID=181527 RepID=A0ACD3AED9_9AGAR|nr:WD40 repeat-like protein [Pluteus cervinus]
MIPDDPDSILVYQHVLGIVLLSGEAITEHTLISLLDQHISASSIKKTIQALLSLLNMDNCKKIHILHPSLADYLLDPTFQPTIYHIDQSQIHYFLFHQSTHILCAQLKFNICNLETSHIPNTQVQDLDQRISVYISQELQYCSQYWAYHLIQSGSYSVMCESVLSQLLINLKTIFWGTSSHYSFYLHELYNFMTKFCVPIQESLPHLYLSALPFCPKSSIIYQRCTSLLKKSIGLMDQSNYSWKAGHVSIPVHSNTPAVFQPHSHLIYFGTKDGTIQHWDSNSGYSVGSPLSGHKTEVRALIASPHHNILYSAGYKSIITWNLSTGQQVYQPVIQHSGWICCLALTPENKYLISGSQDCTIVMWDISQTFPLVRHIFQGPDYVEKICISPDGHYMAAIFVDETVSLWSLITFSKVADDNTESFGIPSSIVFTNDGNQLLIGTSRGKILLRSRDTLELEQEPIQVCSCMINKVYILESGDQLIIVTDDGTLYIYSFPIMTQRCAPVPVIGSPILDLTLSSDGYFLALFLSKGRIEIWDFNLIQSVSQSLPPIKYIQVSPINSFLCVASGTKIVMWNPTSWKKEKIMDHEETIHTFSVSSDEGHIVSSLMTNTALIWCQKNYEYTQVCAKTYNSKIVSISCTNHSRLAYITLENGSVYVLELYASYNEAEIIKTSERIVACEFSSDSCFVAIGHLCSGVFLWNLHTHAMVHHFSLEFAGDIEYPLSANGDYSMIIWNFETGNRVFGSIKCHTNSINSLCNLPQNKEIASGGRDGTLRIWNADPVTLLSSPVLVDTNDQLKVGSFFQSVQFLQCNLDDITKSELCMTSSGWLVHSNRLILWIPPWYRCSLACPQVLCLPFSAPNQSLKIDWSGFAHGTSWCQIYKSAAE